MSVMNGFRTELIDQNSCINGHLINDKNYIKIIIMLLEIVVNICYSSHTKVEQGAFRLYPHFIWCSC